MNRAFLSLICGLALMSAALAQTADDINEGVRFTITPGPSGSIKYTFFWRGRLGRTYFLQHSEDLINWTYFPEVVISGTGEIICYEFFVCGTDRCFLRLKYPKPDIATNDPAGADFDGDKVCNLLETELFTDPLDFADTDGDGMSDDWEKRFGLAPGNPADGSPGADLDEDGLSNLAEYQAGPFGSDPTDYYNGVLPQSIEAISGDGQTSEPGTFLPDPIVLVFKHGAIPVNHGPVTVYIEDADSGQLSLTNDGNGLATTLRARTGSDGQVQVYYKQSPTIPPVPTVRYIWAGAGSAVPSGVFAKHRFYAFSQKDYSYPANTVGLSASDSIDSRIAGKNRAAALSVFSIQHVGLPFTPDVLYERNTASWCYDLRQQMTCISPFYIDAGNGITQYGFTAITQQHVITSGHVDVTSLLNVDDTVRFITADNPTTVITRTIRGKVRHPNYVPSSYYPDFTVCTLDSPLPPTITPCKMLPANYASYLGYLENGRPPAMVLNQAEQASVAELRDLGPSEPSYAYFVRPGLHRKRLEFYNDLIPGDSGNPAFLIIKPPNTGLDTLVLLTTWTGAGPGIAQGTFTTPQISALKAMIAAADADVGNYPPFVPMNTGLQVQTIDLSGFNTYSPP